VIIESRAGQKRDKGGETEYVTIGQCGEYSLRRDT
jgi:hypothetical protein